MNNKNIYCLYLSTKLNYFAHFFLLFVQVPLSLTADADDVKCPTTDGDDGDGLATEHDTVDKMDAVPGADDVDGSSEVKSEDEPSSKVNTNQKKNFNDVLENEKAKNKLRTKNDHDTGSKISSDISDSENTKSKSKAVKITLSCIEDKENIADEGKENCSADEVFVEKPDWPKPVGERQRRSSETAGFQIRKTSTDRSSPPLAFGRPRGILKCRGRSYSESHIGSLEECLGEELLGKYSSVEQALVQEYGCLEGLLEECGWEDDDEQATSPTKKNVTFNDHDKTHRFMSKASIVNQLANDSKRAMRLKMRDQKRKWKIEKRQAQKSGSNSSSGGNNNNSYRNNDGYHSVDDEATTEESDGTELGSTSCDTTDNTTEDETDTGEKMNRKANLSLLLGRSKNKRKKCRKNKSNRAQLPNNMVFQLDLES